MRSRPPHGDGEQLGAPAHLKAPLTGAGETVGSGTAYHTPPHTHTLTAYHTPPSHGGVVGVGVSHARGLAHDYFFPFAITGGLSGCCQGDGSVIGARGSFIFFLQARPSGGGMAVTPHGAYHTLPHTPLTGGTVGLSWVSVSLMRVGWPFLPFSFFSFLSDKNFPLRCCRGEVIYDVATGLSCVAREAR